MTAFLLGANFGAWTTAALAVRWHRRTMNDAMAGARSVLDEHAARMVALIDTKTEDQGIIVLSVGSMN